MTDEEYTKSQIDFVKEQEMARQKQFAPATIELDDEEVGSELQTATQSSAEFALANQLLGRVQFGQGLAKVVTVTTLLDLQKIKEGKLYKHLPITTPDGKSVTVTDFKQFCQLLGRSYEQVNEDINNLEAFGVQALESMQQMGLGYRDLRKLRKLQDDDRNLVIEQVTVDTSDKEAVKESILEILETQAKKHTREKEQQQIELEKAQNQILESQNLLRQKEKVIETKNESIRQRENTIQRLEEERAAASVGEATMQLSTELSDLVNKRLMVGLLDLKVLISKIHELPDDHPARKQCGAEVVRLIDVLQSIQIDHQLEIPEVRHFDWINDSNADDN